MAVQKYDSYSPAQTHALGERLGQEAVPGTVYILVGDLGTGKTVFTQGVARGLGIREPVNSPTFTILQVYEGGRLDFYHFDVYRIGNVTEVKHSVEERHSAEAEMEEIGYEEYFYGNGVCLVEWGDLIKDILPEQYCRITIEKDLEKGFDYRRITIEHSMEDVK